MKVIILYQPKAEHSKQVEEYVHDFMRAQPSTRQIQTIDADSIEGTNIAQLYDIMQYPAVLALSNDGQLLNSWAGQFPLMDELAYYTNDD